MRCQMIELCVSTCHVYYFDNNSQQHVTAVLPIHQYILPYNTVWNRVSLGRLVVYHLLWNSVIYSVYCFTD